MTNDDVNLEFATNEYSKPNQNWVCGWAERGLACPLGPTEKGDCRAVCTPYKRGARYYCNNASVFDGNCDQGPLEDGSCCENPAQCTPIKQGRRYKCGRGICQLGPTPEGDCCRPFIPCRPVRSVLSKRKTVSLFAFVAAIGLAIIMVGGPWRSQMIKPGNLTSHHSSVVGECAACHAVGQQNMQHWMPLLINQKLAPSQTDLCMKCHKDLGDYEQMPHTVDANWLAVVTKSNLQPDHTSHPPSELWLSDTVFPAPDELSCAACHKEHRGAGFDMKQLADSQCQKCHTKAFHSFEKGHPEFSGYPYATRTRIYFDHVSHYNVHFAETARLPSGTGPALLTLGITQASCTVCHQRDASGKHMLVRPFEESCASCHKHQVENDSLAGLKLFSLPMLDPDYADDTAWHAATRHRDKAHPQVTGTLPPIMRLLLSADDDFATLDREMNEIDLSDLRNESDESRAKANRLIDVIKTQLDSIELEGQKGIEARLTKSLGAGVSPDEVTQMAALLEHSRINMAANQFDWSLPRDPFVLQMNAYRSLPKKMRLLLSANAEFATLSGRLNDIDLSDTQTVSNEVREAIKRICEMARTEFDKIQLGGQSEIEARLALTLDPNIEPQEITRLAAEWNEELTDEWIDSIRKDFNKKTDPQSHLISSHAGFSRGWQLRLDDLSLRYQPTGHADPLLRIWIEVAARLGGDANLDTPMRDVFLQLSHPTAAGECMKCHSVQRNEDGPGLVVNWSPYERPTSFRPFTHFSHQPHLVMLSDNACRECHRLKQPSEGESNWNPYRREFIAIDGRVSANVASFSSHFKSMKTADCTACHRPTRVSQNCTTCHNYHVNTVGAR